MNDTRQTSNPTAIILQFFQVVDQRPLDKEQISQFIPAHFIDHDRPAQVPEGVSDYVATLDFFASLAEAFPDGQHEIEFTEVLPNDRILVRWNFTGTHKAALFGIPPKGNPVNIHGFDVFKLNEGQLAEQWHIEEIANLFQQINA